MQPLKRCVVSNCGRLPPDTDIDTCAPVLVSGAHPCWPDDLPPLDTSKATETQQRLAIADDLKTEGNALYAAGRYGEAAAKYSQALRYAT